MPPRNFLFIFHEQFQALQTPLWVGGGGGRGEGGRWGHSRLAIIQCTRCWPGLLVQGKQPRLERHLFRMWSPPFPLPSHGRGTQPQQSHMATKEGPSYRAPAPHLTAGAPALPMDVQALSRLVAQQVVQQLLGSHHPPPWGCHGTSAVWLLLGVPGHADRPLPLLGTAW